MGPFSRGSYLTMEPMISPRACQGLGLGLAVILLAGCTGGNTATPAPTTPQPTVTASPTPTATATPTTVRPSPTATGPAIGRLTPIPAPQGGNEFPADKGTLPAGFALPHEGRPVADDEGEWLPADWYTSCLDTPVVIKAHELLTATRIRQQLIPEGANGEGVLAFANDADATAFMEQLRAGYAACADADEPVEGFRTRMASGAETPPVGTEAFSIRTWTEYSSDGQSWTEAPGGSYDLVARQGRFVALAYTGGEYVGDPAGSFTEVNPSRDVASEILARAHA